jgi:nucleotide-binding universal stress UspA family protein
MYSTVIWATDGSEGADVALEEALQLLHPGGKLFAVHVDQHMVGGRAGGLSYLPDEDERRVKIRERVGELQSQGLDVEAVIRTTHGATANVIAEIATDVDADAIVCGTRGFGTLSGAVLGSVAQKLLHVAPCPVVVVPERLRTKLPG